MKWRLSISFEMERILVPYREREKNLQQPAEKSWN
jgi:hypothetical protein